MTKILVTLVTVISLFSLITPDAEAKRMGGSKSFGKQSSNVTKQQAPAQPASANEAAPAAAPGATPTPAAAAKPASPWKGMLGGTLLGLGLGALLSGLGLGAGMSNIISILLMAGIGIALVMFLVRLFKQKSEAASPMKSAYVGSAPGSIDYTSTPEIGSRIAASGRNEIEQQSSSSTSGNTWEIPAGFDVAQFERTAQTYFIRLQAAWDKADINDIREFTTPEMYAEVKLQIQERGTTPSVTDVITIYAKLLGIETQDTTYLASVKFVGTMKEEANGPTISFEEIWNLSKPVEGQGGWLLAGIQQVEQM